MPRPKNISYYLFMREGNMQNMVLLHSDDSLFKDIHLCICGEQKCKPLQGWGPAVDPLIR